MSNQYPRRRRKREQFPNGITSRPFSKAKRTQEKGEDIVIFVPDDLVPMKKEVKDNA